MKNIFALAFVTTVIGFFAAGDLCRAAIVFDNGNHIYSGRQSSFGYEVADDFAFSGDTTITDVHWKGAYGSGAASGVDDFSIHIYDDDGGIPAGSPPGSAIYSASVGAASRTPTGEISLGSYVVYSYSATITPFVAFGGSNYWLGIYNNATSDYWYWSMDFDSGNAVIAPLNANFNPTLDANTFQLTNDAVGTVPEAPSVIVWSVLIGLGLVARHKLPGCFART